MTVLPGDEKTLLSTLGASSTDSLPELPEHEPIVRRVARHLAGRRMIRPGRTVLNCFMGLLLAASLVGLPLAGAFGQAQANVAGATAPRPLTAARSSLPLEYALGQANFAGRDFAIQYYQGMPLTYAAAHAVDLRALQAIDPEFALSFEEYLLELEKTQETAPIGPVVPEATQPEDSADPNAAPTDPAQPEDDADDPAGDAGNPTDPAEPADPSQPAGPDDDPQAGDPTDPNAPDAPANPENPTNPTNPIDPSNPDNPATPDDPANSDTPTTPDTPADPDNPTTPTDPTLPGDDAPATPTDPAGDEPSQAPEDVQQPANPEAATPAPGTGPVATAPQSTPAPSQSSTQSVYPQWSYQGDTAYTPHHYTHDLTTEKFIAVIGEQARQIGQERNIYASVMIAQAILESASGNSQLARAPHNNLFGIKGSFLGKSVTLPTQEDDGTGAVYSIVAPFRSYDSIMDSLDDYADLIRTGLGGYYRPAWKEYAPTFVDACNYLEGHYATDTHYSESLQDLIATYDLTRFDQPLDYEPVTPITVQLVDEETNRPIYDVNGKPVTEQRTLADLVAEATSHLGVDYLWGGTSPELGFDCSGLVQYSYAHALGINLPRTSYYQCLVGQDVNFSDLHMGDLLFFARGDNVYHVAMYLSDGYYIEAPNTGDVVKVTAMESKMPSFAKRIVPTKAADGSTSQAATSLFLKWPAERYQIDA